MPTLQDCLASFASPTGPLKDALGARIALGNLGPFPLARTTHLGDSGVSTPFATGEIRIELTEVVAASLPITSSVAGPGTLSVGLAPLQIRGRYRVFALEQAPVTVDTGGSLLPMAVLGDTDPAAITVEQYDQLMQADAERQQLLTTPNGTQMVNNYNQYNDIYNQVFQTNQVLQGYWKANGATSEMASYTSTALNNGTTINPDPSVKTFGSGSSPVGYNFNSLQQALNVASACQGAGQGDAANAVFSFQSAVSTTGNTQQATVGMNRSQVYQAVSSATPPPSSSGNGVLAKAVHCVARCEHDETHLETLRQHGYDLKPEHIAGMQAIYAEGARQRRAESQVTLWEGELVVSFSESTFRYRFAEHPGVVATTPGRHTLPMPDLQLETAGWGGQAGAIARKRLTSAAFLRGLLVSRVADWMEQRVADAVSSAARRP